MIKKTISYSIFVTDYRECGYPPRFPSSPSRYNEKKELDIEEWEDGDVELSRNGEYAFVIHKASLEELVKVLNKIVNKKDVKT